MVLNNHPAEQIKPRKSDITVHNNSIIISRPFIISLDLNDFYVELGKHFGRESFGMNNK